MAPIEISRSLTPSTGGGSTCIKVDLGGYTHRPVTPPTIFRPIAAAAPVSHRTRFRFSCGLVYTLLSSVCGEFRSVCVTLWG